MTTNDSDNFFLGFVVGALAGVAGFFLTKTKEGREIKDQIFFQWDKIKKKLEEEGLITGQEPSLVDIVNTLKFKITDFVADDSSKKISKNVGKNKRKLATNKNSKSDNKTTLIKKKMFKGI